MKRREVLGGAAGAVVLTWPGWLARAFAQTDPIGADRDRLRAAVVSARSAGRPLFVVVVPAVEGIARIRRGRVWGELLQHGDELVMADLALADVVCALSDDVRAVVPGALEGEPLAMVVEPDGRVTAHDAVLVDSPHRRPDAIEAAIDDHIATLSALVHDALAADDAMVARRAGDARAALGDAIDPLVQALARGAPSLELAGTAPALVYEAYSATLRCGPVALLSMLAAIAIARLRTANVPGSEWEVPWECSMCGMGYTPPRSRRFLRWLVDA